MSAIANELDARKYGRLLVRTLPKAIETDEENDRALAEIERLIDKGDRRNPEEGALLKLLINLSRDFESKAPPDPRCLRTRIASAFDGGARVEAARLAADLPIKRHRFGGRKRQKGYQQESGA